MKYFEEIAKQNNVSKWDLFYINDITKSVHFTDTILEKIDNSSSEGIGIRVIKNGRLGFSNAQSMDSKIDCLKKAIEVSEYGEEIDLALPFESINNSTAYINPEVENISLEEMTATAKKIVEYLKTNNMSYIPACSISNEVYEVKILNSAGLSSSYRKSQYACSFMCSLMEEGNFLRRHKYIVKNDKDIYDATMLETLLREMSILEKKADISRGLYEVVLTPNALINILLAFYYGISGSSIYKKLSPLEGRISEKIFDDSFTIISDPADHLLPDSIPFDDEGLGTSSLSIVNSGYLENFLLDLKSAFKLGLTPNAHSIRSKGLMGNRSHSVTPSPAPYNLQVLPGDISKEDMIKDIKDGLIIDDIMGILMSNLISGEFSGNISTGVRVINGERIGRVKNCMISGNIYELFKNNVVGISKDKLPCITLGFSGVMPYLHLKDIFIS